MLKQQGFTLVELMIVVAVVAILASIAYPSYQNQLQQARRADGTTELLDIASKLERYHSEFGVYPANLVGAGANSLNLADVNSDDGHYAITIAQPAGNQTFTMTATAAATSPQVADAECGALTLTHTGVQGESGTGTPQDCW